MRYRNDVVSLQLCKDSCKGCGVCVEVCPHGVFELKGANKKKAVIVERGCCMECGACAKNCTFGAISVQTGVGCAAALLQGMKRGTSAEAGCCGPSQSACCS